MGDVNLFAETFLQLTGNAPFPWQVALYHRFLENRDDNIPASCNLPTGLGKTSVIACWLIALAHGANVPRRLVYVVNRRTVVDQTTDEVEKYRTAIQEKQELSALKSFLEEPLRISTLRGQFADNREWSADPSRPTVICGTVDMIGSRLLFSGYGVGWKSKPLHAGLLGQDALLVHDEAHLEPAFQTLIESIELEQEREPSVPWPKFRVMELTATRRARSQKPFELTDDEKAIPADLPAKPTEPIQFVWQRMKSKKGLKFEPAKRDAVATKIGEMARDRWKDSDKAVLLFVRTIDDVKEVTTVLTDKKKGVTADQVRQLTGTMRGQERDALATTDDVFARFMPSPKVEGKKGTVFLVCTSAGEVGVDISADHMVCDLSTLDSMAQRFGRVNRRGDGAACIDVVFETDPNAKPPSPAFEAARWETKKVLERLPSCDWIQERHDASPSALGVVMKGLTEEDRDAAFAPLPTIQPATDILFDAWALTSITDKLPGRPMVEAYLHGIADWQPPETHVAWRVEVEKLQPKYASDEEREERQFRDRKALAKLAEELLDEYPLKPHELLQDRMTRVREAIDSLAKSYPDEPAWLIGEDGDVSVTTLHDLTLTEKREGKTVYKIDSRYGTILLPPSVGGLNDQGMLDAKADPPAENEPSLDVADSIYHDKARTVQLRLRTDTDTPPDGMRLLRRVPLPDTGGEEAETEYWYWYVRAGAGDDDASKSSREIVTWDDHTVGVTNALTGIAERLFPDDKRFQDALILAAKWHDLGKKRAIWQRSIGNPDPTKPYAKSGYDSERKRMWKPYELTDYRHEFGSLVDVERENLLESVELHDPDLKELVLHLIAAHHGRARPHFPADEAFDPDGHTAICEWIARETPRRFAKLQRKYGRWGLAYLESLLRAADWAASANPSAFLEDGQ